MNDTSTVVHILIADDDPDDREIFKEIISGLLPDSEISEESGGSHVISYLQNEELKKPDLIFLDINMPCMGGKECLRLIKKNAEWKHIPVIMFTTSKAEEDVNETFTDGASRYIIKPSAMDDYEEIFKQLFSSPGFNHLLDPRKELFVLKAVRNHLFHH